MNLALCRLLVAGFVATSALSAHAAIERIVEKTFTVTNPGTLRIDTSGGSIKVEAGSDATVKVTARQRIKTDSDTEADELLQKLQLTMEQSGGNVTAIAKYEKQPLGFRFRNWPPVSVDFIVTVPAAMASELRTSGGSITVGDLRGRIEARTSGGSITVGKAGSSVLADTSGGSITVGSAQGDVDLDTSGGNIKVGPVAGKADLETSGGGITIESVTSSMRASTSGGSIRASIVGALQEDCSLDTSGGSIRVTVDKAAAFNLDASTSGGSVHADGLTIVLKGEKKPGRSRLAGAVNGGGPTLKLHSSGGGIDITAR